MEGERHRCAAVDADRGREGPARRIGAGRVDVFERLALGTAVTLVDPDDDRCCADERDGGQPLPSAGGVVDLHVVAHLPTPAVEVRQRDPSEVGVAAVHELLPRDDDAVAARGNHGMKLLDRARRIVAHLAGRAEGRTAVPADGEEDVVEPGPRLVPDDVDAGAAGGYARRVLCDRHRLVAAHPHARPEVGWGRADGVDGGGDG